MARSKAKESGVHLLVRKIKLSIGSVATIANSLNYSANHVLAFAGLQGKIIQFDLGDDEKDIKSSEIKVHLHISKENGTKKSITNFDVWVHALDLLEFK